MGKIQQFVNPEDSTERFYPRTLVEAIADLSGSALSSKLGVLAASASVYLADSASLKASASLAGSAIQPSATSSWATAVANSHTHSNKAVLDGITAAKTASWDKAATIASAALATASSAQQKAENASASAALLYKATGSATQPVYISAAGPVAATPYASASVLSSSYALEAKQAVSASILYGEEEYQGQTYSYTASVWDLGAAIGNAHWHSNKSILDSITSAKTASWDASGALAKNVTAITASLVASASVAKTASSSAAALSRITASLVASASIAKTASSSAAALSSKSASWDAKLGSESDPIYLADSASLKASASLASSSYLGDITSLVAGATTGTITLAAGKFTSSSKFTGNVTYALGTAFGTGRASIYAGKFTYNGNYSVTFPNTVEFADNTPDLEADSVYEFSILDGIGVMVKVVS